MHTSTSSYYGHRFPPEIACLVVWFYYRFFLSIRVVEDPLAERGIVVSYETIRRWSREFGAAYARKLKSAGQAQRFLSVHGVIQNLFRVGRHLVSSANHRMLRDRSFRAWRQETCVC